MDANADISMQIQKYIQIGAIVKYVSIKIADIENNW